MVSPAIRTVLFSGPPKWVDPYSPVFQIDLALGRVWMQRRPYYNSADVLRALSTFSTPAHYSLGLDGLLYLVPANTFDYTVMPFGVCRGQLLEEARTNVVLYSNDLTNGAWTPSNITAALDQTGPDGVVNSASSLTAGANNGTILQAITLASSARFQTAYVKRISGVGTVSMTMDNGATWTAVTVTGAWSRVSIPTQTLANPTVGFKLATAGDKIAVWGVDNENGAYATSPIVTTSASVLRAAASMRLSPSLSGMTLRGPLTAKVVATYPVFSGSSFIFRDRADAINNWGFGVNASGLAFYQVSGSGGGPNTWAAISGAVSLLTPVKQTLAVGGTSAADAVGTISTLGSTILPSPQAAFNPTGSDILTLQQPADAYTASITFWPTRLPDASLLSLVA